MTLDDLREALGRELTRDDVRRIEVMAEFHGFDVREWFDGDKFKVIDRTGRKPRRRVKRTRTRYGLRHRLDCTGVAIAPRSDRYDRCLGCVAAQRRARASVRVRPRCAVCSRYFVATPNGSRTCSKACRYSLSSSTRRAAARVSELCRRGHVKTKLRRDGYRECSICKADGQRARRADARLNRVTP